MGSDDWRAGYERGVLAAILAKGRLVSESPSVYGWVDWEENVAVRDHLERCPVESHTIVEAEWDEFEDTEIGTNHYHSIEATVWCACGEVRKRTLRLTNPVSEIIADVLGFERCGTDMDYESEPEPTALPCIVCRKTLQPADPNSRNHPDNGLIFRAHGNYGSTVFDPVSMDGRWLEVNICDDCISTAAEEFAVIHGQPAPRPPRPNPLYRSWRASDPEH